MKKIIAVSGTKNLGKTNTINRLAYKLKNNEADYDFIYQQNDIVVTNDEEHFKRDNRYIFKHKETSIVIGIASCGDNFKIVTDSFKLFEKYHCDICITATRTGGGTIFAVENYQDTYKADVIYISKYFKRVWENIDDINEKTSTVLLSILNHLVIEITTK